LCVSHWLPLGYLIATASEDWALVLDVCDRVSANEANAKEAVKTLRREFKCVATCSSLYNGSSVKIQGMGNLLASFRLRGYVIADLI